MSAHEPQRTFIGSALADIAFPLGGIGTGTIALAGSARRARICMGALGSRSGRYDGEQHNTYDVEFYGPNTMVGCWYLAALKGGTALARAMGDAERADLYERVFRSDREAAEALLWIGEYYVQRIPSPADARLDPAEATPWHAPAVVADDPKIRYQYGTGCLADQLAGQWFAQTVGLGDLPPAEHVRTALQSLIRYDWRTNLVEHTSVQRIYALNDEPALLECTWPHGGRPTLPFPYADEAWTGVEYAAAAHCIQSGLPEEGLEIVRGLRFRYDGERRNPWDEVECGHHYARHEQLVAVARALRLSLQCPRATDPDSTGAPRAFLQLLLQHWLVLGHGSPAGERDDYAMGDRNHRRAPVPASGGAARAVGSCCSAYSRHHGRHARASRGHTLMSAATASCAGVTHCQ